MNKVLLLEKPENQTWSQNEVDMLMNRSRVEIERLGAKPHRLGVMSKPVGEPIAVVLEGIQFTTREVDYRDRWM
jgi:hypothetical protein